MTQAQAQQNILKGTIPVEIIWGGAELILNAIIGIFQKRAALRVEVERLQGVCLTQGQQIKVLETRLSLLEASK
jgi:hypothetical protein